MRKCSDDEFYPPSFIHLYEGTDPSELNVEEIAAFLQEFLPKSTINVRENFFRYWFQRCKKIKTKATTISKRLAQVKIKQPDSRDLNPDPLPGEVDFEFNFLTAGSSKPVGILYDGYHMIAIYSDLLVFSEMKIEHCHIVLTKQMLGTWDENDCRYHVRISIYGFPSMISTTGIVEGPARPREYYLGRRLGADQTELEKALSERYIGYRDTRLQEIIKGYLLQALFYHITGDPFCNDRDCRLFNAHWQEEMIYAQLRPGAGLCDFHRQIMERASYG